MLTDSINNVSMNVKYLILVRVHCIQNSDSYIIDLAMIDYDFFYRVCIHIPRILFSPFIKNYCKISRIYDSWIHMVVNVCICISHDTYIFDFLFQKWFTFSVT